MFEIFKIAMLPPSQERKCNKERNKETTGSNRTVGVTLCPSIFLEQVIKLLAINKTIKK